MKVEFDGETETLKLDGVRIALQALTTIANPNPGLYYRFARVGETVFLNSFVSREGVEQALKAAAIKENQT